TEEIIVTIQDTGIGMSEECLSNLFQAFSQESAGHTKRFQGVGLGLALTKRYLELNEVVIEVTSKQDVGTTIKLVFPKTIQD
ncbi:MAG: hybrid sensor histidine kinase/response regulator, partial [Candidatus Marinimicrobia bacterium CG_4_9_14_3_um_filter_48_9]